MLVATAGDDARVRDEVRSLLPHAQRDDLDEFLPALLAAAAAGMHGAGAWRLGANQQLGPYLLEAEIGRGGMGVVYRARHVEQNRVVALKVILGEPPAGATAVQRFYREARAAANLDHPHIVPVYEVGQYGDFHCFSMPLIEGGSLADRLDRERLPQRAAVQLMKAVTEAVDFVHRQGVVHRDLKPANILLDAEGSPQIADFGLALRGDADDGTGSGEVLGTVAYMAPEQARGEAAAVGPHSDQYSLGVVLYQLLTGRTPFTGRDYELLARVAHDKPPPPREANSAVPQELEAICLRAMHRDPGGRYESVGRLAEDLGRFLAGEPVRAALP